MPNLSEQRQALLDQATQIKQAAQADGDRPLTDPELVRLKTVLDQVDGLDESIARSKKSEALFAGLEQLGFDDSDVNTLGHSGGPAKHLALTSIGRRQSGVKLAQAIHAKGVTVTGNAVTEIPVAGPIEQGRIPTSILDVLPVIQHPGGVFKYFRQTGRTFRAAVVAPGAKKPESDLTVTSVDGALEIIAHIATGLHVYDLVDMPALGQWVGDEMLYGLGLAVEQEILSGDGSTGHLRGILNTSGIQTQAAGADIVTTVRQAITKVQTAGYAANAVVLHPEDWATAETARATTGGGFDFAPGAPIDAAAQRLWGVAVVLSTTIAAKTAMVLDTSTVAVDTDTQGIRLQWSEFSGTDFESNLLRVRCEGRFGVSVYQPSGVVKVTLPEPAAGGGA